jgi:hypothetical protein
MESRHVLRAALALIVMSGGALPARAEERTIQAAAPWEGRVRVYVTGPRQGFLLGSFAGRLAVEKEPSSLDAAQLVCPAAIDLDYTANTQRGEGRCVITVASGDRLFARWNCVGEPDRGCTGRFVLTGGTGVYQGVTGDGDFALRLTLSDLVRMERLEADYDLAGVASWPVLRYRTP